MNEAKTMLVYSDDGYIIHRPIACQIEGVDIPVIYPGEEFYRQPGDYPIIYNMLLWRNDIPKQDGYYWKCGPASNYEPEVVKIEHGSVIHLNGCKKVSLDDSRLFGFSWMPIRAPEYYHKATV